MFDGFHFSGNSLQIPLLFLYFSKFPDFFPTFSGLANFLTFPGFPERDSPVTHLLFITKNWNLYRLKMNMYQIIRIFTNEEKRPNFCFFPVGLEPTTFHVRSGRIIHSITEGKDQKSSSCVILNLKEIFLQPSSPTPPFLEAAYFRYEKLVSFILSHSVPSTSEERR